ncbi:MAG: phosphomannomutase [Deltaproteobacteria bacterium]|nr:phosphomannomutase [Deltaproteobacteria bacterium]MDL1961703.1 phosphomannomutase [Deltaproteobacteria bacterium]
MGGDLVCFMAYDIRGRIPDQLNEAIAFRIGRSYAEFLKPEQVVVGRDVRLSSESICDALSQGLMESGVNVFDIGLCGTEEVYFATFHHHMDGGIMVTASHNPRDFNGMKLVREEARPVSGDTGLHDIRRMAEQGLFSQAEISGQRRPLANQPDYIRHLLHYVDIAELKPLKIVINSGNGCAGPVMDALEPHLPFEFIKIQHQPDGTFPNGIPNPLLPENRSVTSKAVLSSGADLGVAWDGDFDRCFFFDEKGRFIEGYYIVGLLAEAFLAKKPGEKIIHDPRLTWNTIDIVTRAGGIPIQNKTGHAFMKERMRSEDAVYGGEMSAHHYFRDFAYCDSGMIPWLLIAGLMSQKEQPLSAMLDERMAMYPASGEINRRLDDPVAAIARTREVYEPQAHSIDETDGISMEFDGWRFNLRCSNTEPVLRLNVESREDVNLMQKKTEELLALIDTSGYRNTSQ